jgi:hypothetical protein
LELLWFVIIIIDFIALCNSIKLIGFGLTLGAIRRGWLVVDRDRQAPGQARLAKLSAERSAGPVFSSCSRRTRSISGTGFYPCPLNAHVRHALL